MPLRIGSEVAFSLPWKGSSTAILIVPLLVSPPPPPPELGAVLAPDELHAANARALTAASAPNLCSFIQVSSKPTVVAYPAQHRGRDRGDPRLIPVRRSRRPSRRSGAYGESRTSAGSRSR